MIQLFFILIFFILFVFVFMILRVVFAARQMFFGKGKSQDNTGYQAPKSEHDEASVKAKRFDKSKAEDVEFEVIKD